MPKRRRDRPVTLIELCVERAGYRRGAKVMAFVVAWARVRQDLGRSPSVEEYAEWWKQPRRTAFEEQERFREAFPEYGTPDPLLDAMSGTDGATATVDAAAIA